MFRCGTVGTGVVVVVVVVSVVDGGAVITGRGVAIGFDAGVVGGSSFTVGSVDRKDVGRGDGVMAGVGTTSLGV